MLLFLKMKIKQNNMAEIDERVRAIENFLASSPVAAANTEILNLLSRIVENQEIDRRNYERNNPLITDNPVYDWLELSTPSGSQATFSMTVPEGSVFFFEYFNITWAANTTYTITIDSVGPPTLPLTTDTIQDFGDHLPLFKPPRMCYRTIVLTALNGDNNTHIYDCFIRGFFRSSTKVDKQYFGQR